MANDEVSRRDFVRQGVAVGLAAVTAASGKAAPEPEKVPVQKESAKAPVTPANGMPYGTIRDLKISRLILGSNVPGVHSRDLIYVTSLGKAYNTREKMLETYALAESQGINVVLQGGGDLVKEYNKTRGGHLRTIRFIDVQPQYKREDIKRELAEVAKDDLAAAGYLWGNRCDYLARAKRMDQVGIAMEVARELGIVLGVGGHSLEVPIQCEALGIKPDFYVKTLHNDNYWSATPKEFREPYCWYDSKGEYNGKVADHDRYHDNIWCLDPEETIKVMRKVAVPWIAFKVLAAGAIHPRQGFSYAFRNGADFIAVGMLDFQIRENVDLVKRAIPNLKERDRPWRA